MNRPITFQTRELAVLRAAVARRDTPENRAAYLRGVAEHVRREADRLDAEAGALLTGGTPTA